MCMCNEEKKVDLETVEEPTEEAVQAAETTEEQYEAPVEEPKVVVEGFLNASECATEILNDLKSKLEEEFQAVRQTMLEAVKQARVNGMDAKSTVEMQARIPAMTEAEVPPAIRQEMHEAGWEIVEDGWSLLVRPKDKTVCQLEKDLEKYFKGHRRK